MITPCNAENGCGTLMHTGSTGSSASAFAPAEGLDRSQMTNVTSSHNSERRQMQNSAAQNPGMTAVPSQTGMISSTFPMPGTVPQETALPEMIPGQPDPPFSQTAPQPSANSDSAGQNQPAQSFPSASAGSNPGSLAGIVPPPVLPDAPQFAVPLNPLMPPGYQEYISYENLQYLNGFLRTQIGKYMRVEQQVGSNSIEERYGYLIGVGINYILLQELGTGNVSTLDYYNIKFVYIYYTNPSLPQNPRR